MPGSAYADGRNLQAGNRYGRHLLPLFGTQRSRTQSLSNGSFQDGACQQVDRRDRPGRHCPGASAEQQRQHVGADTPERTVCTGSTGSIVRTPGLQRVSSRLEQTDACPDAPHRLQRQDPACFHTLPQPGAQAGTPPRHTNAPANRFNRRVTHRDPPNDPRTAQAALNATVAAAWRRRGTELRPQSAPPPPGPEHTVCQNGGQCRPSLSRLPSFSRSWRQHRY